MVSTRKRILLLLLLAVGSGPLLQDRIATLRKEEHLDPTDAAEGIDPFTFVSTVALGNLRSVLINVYWIQADVQAAERRWYALRSTFEVIAKLQPYNPYVWTYNGWNLAYNISVTLETPEEQWPWVQAGLEYAMRGAEKNPENMALTSDIGFYFWHKIRQSPYFQKKCLETYGADAYTIAARWYERAHALPDHSPVVDTMLATGCYSVLAAQALLEDDLGRYRELRNRIETIRKHILEAHSEWVTRGNLPPIPLDGTLLMRQISRSLQEGNIDLAIRYARKAASWFAENQRPVSSALARLEAELLELEKVRLGVDSLSEKRVGRKHVRRQMSAAWNRSWITSGAALAAWRRKLSAKGYYKFLRQTWRYPEIAGIVLRDRHFPQYPQIVFLGIPRLRSESIDVWYARQSLYFQKLVIRNDWINRIRFRTSQTEE